MRVSKIIASVLFGAVLGSLNAIAGDVLVPEQDLRSIAQSQLLPDPFPVWSVGGGVVNHPGSGGVKKDLQTINEFKGSPGCYLACYARDRDQGVYSVGGDIFVMGQVRVPGIYTDRICRPDSFKGDVSAEQKFKDLCNKHVKRCHANCWAGGDTGGWFGIP